MRLIKYSPLIIVMLMLLVGCSYSSGGSDLKIEASPSDKSIVELASKTYDETQLSELVVLRDSINEVNLKYPIECLREINGTYRASYLGDKKIAVLLFDDSGNWLLGKIYCTQRTKSDFDSLKVGQRLDEVRAIDPDGEYLFLYTGRNDVQRVSSHYTRDGYLITIRYDDSNIVISIHRELI